MKGWEVWDEIPGLWLCDHGKWSEGVLPDV